MKKSNALLKLNTTALIANWDTSCCTWPPVMQGVTWHDQGLQCSPT